MSDKLEQCPVCSADCFDSVGLTICPKCGYQLDCGGDIHNALSLARQAADATAEYWEYNGMSLDAFNKMNGLLDKYKAAAKKAGWITDV